jgi:predicted nucleic acid-binding protein
VIVIDAGAWVRALVDKSTVGDAARQVLRDDPEWAAPVTLDERLARAARALGAAVLVPTSRTE